MICPPHYTGIVEVFRVAKRVYCSMKDVDKGEWCCWLQRGEGGECVCDDASSSRCSVCLAGEMTDCVDSIFKHWKKIGSLLPKNVMVRYIVSVVIDIIPPPHSPE